MTVNKFGLSRDIPEPIQRQVRKRCGFGCVVCGNAIYQYEHLDPPFAEANVHDPEKIVLLCGGCHDKVTRKFLSKESVSRAAQNPKALRQGFSFTSLDVGVTHPKIVVGKIHAVNVKGIIQIYGEEILSISTPEEIGMPYIINAHFYNQDQIKVLEIRDNECIGYTSNWDIQAIGGKFTVRRKDGDISLILQTEPPDMLVVKFLKMYYRDVKIICRENSPIRIETKDGNSITVDGIAYIKDGEFAINISEEYGIEIGGGNIAQHQGMKKEVHMNHSDSKIQTRTEKIYQPIEAQTSTRNRGYIQRMEVAGAIIEDLWYENIGRAAVSVGMSKKKSNTDD